MSNVFQVYHSKLKQYVIFIGDISIKFAGFFNIDAHQMAGSLTHSLAVNIGLSLFKSALILIR